MTTGLYSHPACLKHNPGPDRSFGPARMETILAALRGSGLERLVWHEAPPVAQDILRLIHTQDYIHAVLTPVSENEQRAFDFETFAVMGTAEAALHASGQVVEATRAVVSGETDNAFCVVSPGGHHAEADMALGYCFFNHVALAAIGAQKNLRQSRIAVLDFDAHHGNGTQSFFWNFEDRLYVSLHEDNPLTGFAHETGAWNNVLNIPLATGSDGTVFRQVIETIALPKIEAFRPDILFVSAGFDMHKDDPLAGLCLVEEDYGYLGRRLRTFTNDLCHGHLVAVLEGGYNLDVLGKSVVAFVKGLMEK